MVKKYTCNVDIDVVIEVEDLLTCEAGDMTVTAKSINSFDEIEDVSIVINKEMLRLCISSGSIITKEGKIEQG